MSPQAGSLTERFDAVCVQENLIPFLIAFAAALVCYSSLYTDVIFTNHTIPNVEIYSYPSFKTNSEGRWFADIVIWLGGGGGTQSFQAIAGFAIQALNGVLFAELLRVRGSLNRSLIALLVALNPAILDYYAFTIDNIGFTFGDTLILSGVLVLDRHRRVWLAAAAAIILFTLALATYPPKLSVIAVVLIAWIATLAISSGVDRRLIFRSVAMAALCYAAALGFYWLSLVLTIDFTGAERTHINSPSEAIQGFLASYASVESRLVLLARGLANYSGVVALLALLAGAAVLLVRAIRRGLPISLLCLAALALLPPAINLSYVVNDQTWVNSGRLVTGYAYAVPFLISVLMTGEWSAGLARAFAGVTIYGFTVVAIQENGLATMKSLFEVEQTSRIVGRIEQILPDDASHPLVVIGTTTFPYQFRLLSQTDRAFGIHLSSTMFAPYRQAAIANFFLGRPLLEYPTSDQVSAALSSATNRTPWPSLGSVYMEGDIVIVVLERPGPGVSTTWAVNREWMQ